MIGNIVGAMSVKMSITPANLMPRHIKRLYNGCIIAHDYFTFQNSAGIQVCGEAEDYSQVHLHDIFPVDDNRHL